MTADTSNRAPSGRFWAFVPVALLGTGLVGLGTLASIATNDPSFALEPNYYERAVQFEREQLQRAENERLGYALSLELTPHATHTELVLTLKSRGGGEPPPAQVSARAFANARAGDVRELTFERGSDGRYRAKLAPGMPGLWEFRCSVLAGDERYTEIVRADVPGGRRVVR
jgi:hypothetical protein